MSNIDLFNKLNTIYIHLNNIMIDIKEISCILSANQDFNNRLYYINSRFIQNIIIKYIYTNKLLYISNHNKTTEYYDEIDKILYDLDDLIILYVITNPNPQIQNIYTSIKRNKRILDNIMN